MSDFERLVREKGSCCICSRPMKDSRYISLAQLDKKAAWEYPVWDNIIIEGFGGRAVAVVCDTCYDAKESGKDPGHIKFAVELQGEEVIMHKAEDLEDVPPILQGEMN